MTDSDSLPPPPRPYRREKGDADRSSRPRTPHEGWRWPTEPAAEEPPPRYPWQRPGVPAGLEPAEGFKRNTVFIGIGLALAVFLVLQLLGAGILYALDEDPAERWELLTGLIVTLLVDAIAMVVVPLYLVGGPRRAGRALGLAWPGGRALAWGALGLGIAWAVLGAYLWIVDVIGIDELDPVSTIDENVIYEHVELVILTGVLAVLLAPVAEEIFFRGFLIRGLAVRLGVPLAMVLSSVLFAGVHLDVGSLIPFTLVGLAFAWVYLQSGSLASAMVAHFLFNLIAFIGTIADRGVG